MKIIDALKIAAKAGNTAYAVEGQEEFGFVVTKKGNVLCVNRATFGKSGVTFTFEYRPSRSCGTGCSCMDGDTQDWGVSSLDAEDIEKFESAGKAFAHELHAPLYRSAEEWKQTTYWKDLLIEVVA